MATSARGVPAWLPAYTAAQEALLVPVERRIQVAASRVFPDLERFGYASNRPLANLEEAAKFTRLIATVLTDSPRFYSLDDAAPELSNPVAQFGPPGADEPDVWATTERGAGGIGRLVRPVVPAEARAAFERGEAAARAKDSAGAIAAYASAAEKAGAVPAPRLALADVLLAGEDLDGAEKAYRAVLLIDPTVAPAHQGLARIAEKSGRLPAARAAIAEALAYQPNSRRALEIARRFGAGGAPRANPFPIFLDVDGVGAVHVGASGGNAHQMYAACRGVMRFEPEVRATIFEQPSDTPYYLSVVEEVVCLEAAIGAYLIERSAAPAKEPIPELEMLVELARQEGLSAFALYEILGQYRPERARLAPPDVHRAVVKYVERHVLDPKGAGPAGVYTAAR